MRTERFTRDINVPDLEDFVEQYPTRARFAKDFPGIFEFIVSPENQVRMQFATDEGRPALQAIAEEVTRRRGVAFTDWEKQSVGMVVCCAMESNRYRRTGRKRSVGRGRFVKAEVYERVRDDEELRADLEERRDEWKEKGGRPWAAVEQDLERAVGSREKEAKATRV
jgi:hypothetical protein